MGRGLGTGLGMVSARRLRAAVLYVLCLALGVATALGWRYLVPHPYRADAVIAFAALPEGGTQGALSLADEYRAAGEDVACDDALHASFDALASALTISCRSPDPARARSAANAAARVIVAQVNARSPVKINPDIARLERRLAELDRELASFAPDPVDGNGAPDPDPADALPDGAVPEPGGGGMDNDAIATARAALAAELADIRRQVAAVEQRPGASAADADVARQLRQHRGRLEAEHAALLARFRADYPPVIAKAEAIAAIDARLDRMAQRGAEDAADEARELRRREVQIMEEMTALETADGTGNLTVPSFSDPGTQQASLTAMRGRVAERLDTLRSASPDAAARLLRAAQEPAARDRPDTATTLLAGLTLGALLALALCLIRRRVAQRAANGQDATARRAPSGPPAPFASGSGSPASTRSS